MNELTLKNIEGFLVKKVTKFGNGAKVDCPKHYLGKTVYLVVMNNGTSGSTEKDRAIKKRKRRA